MIQAIQLGGGIGVVSTVLNPFPTSIYFQSYARHPETFLLLVWNEEEDRSTTSVFGLYLLLHPSSVTAFPDFGPFSGIPEREDQRCNQPMLDEASWRRCRCCCSSTTGEDREEVQRRRASPHSQQHKAARHEWPRRTRASGARAHALSPLVPRAGQSPPPLDAGPAV